MSSNIVVNRLHRISWILDHCWSWSYFTWWQTEGCGLFWCWWCLCSSRLWRFRKLLPGILQDFVLFRLILAKRNLIFQIFDVSETQFVNFNWSIFDSKLDLLFRFTNKVRSLKNFVSWSKILWQLLKETLKFGHHFWYISNVNLHPDTKIIWLIFQIHFSLFRKSKTTTNLFTLFRIHGYSTDTFKSRHKEPISIKSWQWISNWFYIE